MTRKDSVRASSTAKDSVRHAAEVVAPYAESARDTAVHYAHEAGARLGPRASRAAHQARCAARDGYDQHVLPRLAQAREQARQNLPHEWEVAAERAARRTRRAARQAGDYAAPRIESALKEAQAAAGPAKEEAAARSAAALAALRGQVSPREIEKLSRRRSRRACTGRALKRAGVLALLAGGCYAAWRWWDKQANPDWLVEPPAATEVGDRDTLAPEEGPLDPEVRAKQAEAEGGEGTR
ncbi:DUF5324 family protein [Streptomyces sp. HNM0574]|uniref:DUF5324 family protein n=1 Tax=Streptomyces sp. HNM0574 TaxID=2714954 RepID=UPI00146D1BF0|nr:DUF5324 family protein [Streptomyces sp. HNM0574]